MGDKNRRMKNREILNTKTCGDLVVDYSVENASSDAQENDFQSLYQFRPRSPGVGHKSEQNYSRSMFGRRIFTYNQDTHTSLASRSAK